MSIALDYIVQSVTCGRCGDLSIQTTGMLPEEVIDVCTILLFLCLYC